MRSAGAYLCARAHASRAAYTARSHDGRDVRERERTRQVDGEERRRRRGKGRGGTRDREDGRPGRRRAGGRGGRAGAGAGEGGGGEDRARRRTAAVPVLRRGRRKRIVTHTAHRGNGATRSVHSHMCTRVLSLSLSLPLFLFSLFPSGSRALLRHHEYLIIMSRVTSESPPSDSSRAEFHR